MMQNKVIKCKIIHSMAAILPKDELNTYLVYFLHVALLSIVNSTLINALNNNQSTTWLGLDTKLVSKHLLKV